MAALCGLPVMFCSVHAQPPLHPLRLRKVTPRTMAQVLGTYRMDYDEADIIETPAQGSGHYEYLQVHALTSIL